MSCPGSVALIKELNIEEESDEPEYRGLGIAAHEAGAHCLRNGMDSWEVIGEKFHGYEVDQGMAQAVQVYLDTVRKHFSEEGAVVYIEHGISYQQQDGRVAEILDPRADSLLKRYFYGTGDCCVIHSGGRKMHVTDYKHGEGIIVEAAQNPQLMYYAFGFLLLHPEVDIVTLRIVQPRTFDEPVKTWATNAEFIKNWVADKLVPAMQLTEVNGAELDAGSWCRFCPAKLVCPLMASLFGAACKTNPKTVVDNSNATLGRSYQYRQAVGFYLKALEEEVYRRLHLGQEVPGCKLVPKKANRVLEEGAAALFKEKFGADAMCKPEIKSPSELEKLGETAKALVREYAYTPQTGLTVATDDDKRVAVKVQSSQQAFGAAVEKLGEENG
jgi:hypothetical protein